MSTSKIEKQRLQVVSHFSSGAVPLLRIRMAILLASADPFALGKAVEPAQDFAAVVSIVWPLHLSRDGAVVVSNHLRS